MKSTFPDKCIFAIWATSCTKLYKTKQILIFYFFLFSPWQKGGEGRSYYKPLALKPG